MASKKGPVEGTRVIVKLPFKGATNNEDQFTMIKKPVAEALNFEVENTSKNFYEVSANVKDDPDKKTSGTKKIKRVRLPGYRNQSIRVIFEKAKTINKKSVKSVSFPITSSVLIYDVIEYFETGKGKGLDVEKIITSRGQTYPISPKKD